MLKRNLRKKIIFVLYILFLCLILINFNPRLFQDDIVSNHMIINDYESCTITTNQLQTIRDLQFEEVRKTVSVVPEINNLKCLGKVINFEEVEDNKYIVNVAESKRFSAFIENFMLNR